jgi:hypothetical protein
MSVLKAPKVGASFRLYVATKDKVIGVVQTQDTEGKEHVITYLSRRLVELKQGTLLLRNYVYAYFMHVPS